MEENKQTNNVWGSTKHLMITSFISIVGTGTMFVSSFTAFCVIFVVFIAFSVAFVPGAGFVVHAAL